MTQQELEAKFSKYANLSTEARFEEYQCFVSLSDKELEILIMPGGKWNWQFAAEIIHTLGYPKIQPILPQMMMWLQDVNWPGTDIIIETLSEIDKVSLIPLVEQTLSTAAMNQDEMWIGGIKRLVDRTAIRKADFLSPNTYDLLDLADF